MALIMAVVIFTEFGQTYPASLASSRPLPWLLHLHAAVFASWVLLFVVQPALAVRGSMAHIGLSFLPKPVFVMGNL